MICHKSTNDANEARNIIPLFIICCLCLRSRKFYYVRVTTYYSFCDRSNIPFLRLDGTLNQQQREKVLKQFSEDRDILVVTSDFIIFCFSLWVIFYCIR